MQKELKLFALGAVFLCGAGVARGEEPFFMGLGHLDGYESGGWASSVSGDGRVVVGACVAPDNGPHMGFRWMLEEGMVPLGFLPGGDYSAAEDVSADGSVIVGLGTSEDSTPGEHYEAFKWTQETGLVGLGDLPGGDFDCRAKGVSADGTVVVGRGEYNDGVGSPSLEAVRWTEDEGIVSIGGFSDDVFSSATATSGDGSVIVGQALTDVPGEIHAFRWTEEGGMIDLGDLDPECSRHSLAWDVATNGLVVVGESQVGGSDLEAFRWTEETGMVGLGELPGGNHTSYAYAVSADGEIIVGYSHGDLGGRPFIWDAEYGMRNLMEILEDDYGFDLSDWHHLTSAKGISDDGNTIVGTGVRNGISEGWIAHIPEPTTLTFLLVGGILISRTCRRCLARIAE
jgi:probable HAF family extracellular repeat protein